jgi:UDP-N-acetylglucosamine--N-acetylmuramyl-(pentapeptide) pyrophosphoryl-undecaprenol N-acetylglucosamine transferase
MYHVYRGFKVMKPQIVIGFGGYPSFPAVSVAQGLKIPTIIHEQNAVLGQVNRILSKYTKHVAVSFEQTERLTANVPVTVTGTPVRNAFYMFRETNYTQLKSNDAIYLLITGGSQGARIFSTIIPVAVSQLPESTRQRLCLIHQCPPKDVEHLKAEYTKYRINATVIDFIENMAEAISKAHLIIARAGASTLAELSIVGRPAILVPFPGAKDDHQWVNAQSIEATKAGWCVRQERFSVEYLVHQLELLIQNPKMLYDAAMNMKAFGRPKATEHIVNLIETQLNKD